MDRGHGRAGAPGATNAQPPPDVQQVVQAAEQIAAAQRINAAASAAARIQERLGFSGPAPGSLVSFVPGPAAVHASVPGGEQVAVPGMHGGMQCVPVPTMGVVLPPGQAVAPLQQPTEWALDVDINHAVNKQLLTKSMFHERVKQMSGVSDVRLRGAFHKIGLLTVGGTQLVWVCVACREGARHATIGTREDRRVTACVAFAQVG